jgi:hypothetical protein
MRVMESPFVGKTIRHFCRVVKSCYNKFVVSDFSAPEELKGRAHKLPAGNGEASLCSKKTLILVRKKAGGDVLSTKAAAEPGRAA